MKLYDSPGAPNPRRVRIYLHEKGIEVPVQEVSIPKGEHRREPYLSKHRLGLVPILELDDGTVLSESVAICRYFEELHPDPPLFGSGALERAQVEMWNRLMEFQIFLPYAMVFRNTHEFFKGRIPQVAEWGELNRKVVQKNMQWLDGELADREFVAGERYSVADITAQCGFDFFGRILKILPGEELPHLSRWYQAVSARESARL